MVSSEPLSWIMDTVLFSISYHEMSQAVEDRAFAVQRGFRLLRSTFLGKPPKVPRTGGCATQVAGLALTDSPWNIAGAF